MRKQWNEEDIEFLKNNYQEMTNKELAEILGRTKSAIDLKANKLGLKNSIYSCDLNYFNSIDTEEKAYWLGFIVADGWIEWSEGANHTIGIELAIIDIEHLRKFNKSIGGNYNIKTRSRHLEATNKDYEMCYIKIHKKTFIKNLIDIHGVIPNKSLSISMPNTIPENLMRHFIRGYFDGDGCIAHAVRKNKNGSTLDLIQADFTCGSIEFINSVRSILYSQGIKAYICQEHNKPYRLRIGGLENTYNFLNYLYDDCNIYLERKYRKRLYYYDIYNIKERVASLHRNV